MMQGMPRPKRQQHNNKKPRPLPKGNPLDWPLFEAEVLPGLEEVTIAELNKLDRVVVLGQEKGSVTFRTQQPSERLHRLRTVVAIYAAFEIEAQRPSAFLGDANLRGTLQFAQNVARAGKHASFRVSAAGKDSAVIERLTEAMADGLKLPHDAEEGELLLRLRRAGERWRLLARTSPRPLSARPWRVCNREGGLNASIAHAMLLWAGLRTSDRVFNPMVGSGTLLIERALMGPYRAMVGVDIDAAAVECSKANLKAAGREVEVARVDALQTGLPARQFDLILADLPWGDDIGSHAGNADLYPRFLDEMYRLTALGGRMAVITHEIKLFERLLPNSAWQVGAVHQVYSGGHHPKIYLLHKSKRA